MDGKEQIVFRTMQVRDIPGVQVVERQCFTVPWSRGIFHTELTKNDNAHYIVAQLGEEIVGYAGVWIILDEGHITNIAVHPKYQRRGIGRQLMEEITAYAVQRGAVRMTLEVRVSNFTAQRLYSKLGYEVCGVRKGYYQDTKEDAYIMWKDLKPDEKWFDAGN